MSKQSLDADFSYQRNDLATLYNQWRSWHDRVTVTDRIVHTIDHLISLIEDNNTTIEEVRALINNDMAVFLKDMKPLAKKVKINIKQSKTFHERQAKAAEAAKKKKMENDMKKAKIIAAMSEEERKVFKFDKLKPDMEKMVKIFESGELPA